ncbi:hypothetical protein KR018_001762, partial [Drosophila ironensis]
MNQVWVFFKLIEVVLGCMCITLHVRGFKLGNKEMHYFAYCATYLSFTLLAALGAFRMLVSHWCVLSTQFILTLTAALAHYFCGLRVMRHVHDYPALTALKDTDAYFDHPNFVAIKQQSVAALITGTMYLMHMFHVLDIIMRMEPGAWRLQGRSRIAIQAFGDAVRRDRGLYVLSKPVDDFLCRRSEYYEALALSQPLELREYVGEKGKFIIRMWKLFHEVRGKLLLKEADDSDDSNISSPSIVDSPDDVVLNSIVDTYTYEQEERLQHSGIWRGVSASFNLPEQTGTPRGSTESSQGNERPSASARIMSWKKEEEENNKRKSEVLMIEGG